MDNSTQENGEQKLLFGVIANKKGFKEDLCLINLTFNRLFDDIVIPYHSGDTFFIDGVPVDRSNLEKIKIVKQDSDFGGLLSALHRKTRHGPLQQQKLYADKYHIKLEAIIRESTEDVTSQIIKAYNNTVKPKLKDYLLNKKEILSTALNVFITGMKWFQESQ